MLVCLLISLSSHYSKHGRTSLTVEGFAFCSSNRRTKQTGWLGQHQEKQWPILQLASFVLSRRQQTATQRGRLFDRHMVTLISVTEEEEVVDGVRREDNVKPPKRRKKSLTKSTTATSIVAQVSTDAAANSNNECIAIKKTKERTRKTTKTETDSVVEKKKRKSRKGSLSDPPFHWLDANDGFELVAADNDDDVATIAKSNSQPSMLRFTVRGNPRPLQRHRTSRGFVYNPSAPAQESFRNVVTDLINGNNQQHKRGERTTPFFGNETLAMTIVFRLKRPNSHFVANRPGPDRLRLTAPLSAVGATTGADVDNLAKFVLDSLNGVLYQDDRQIASLHVTKLLDEYTEENECRGSTHVCLRVLTQHHVDDLLKNALDLY